MLGHHPAVSITSETHWFDDLRLRIPAQESALTEEHRRPCQDWFLSLGHRPFGHGGDPSKSWLDRSALEERAQQLGGGRDAYFQAYCQLDGERNGKVRWGEKTPRHAYRIPEILEAFPHAQVICLARDPRAVVASYRDWKSQGGHDLEADPEHELALKEEHARTRASYHPVIASLMWSSAILAADRARKKFGDNKVLLLRYEDLVLDPEATNAAVCEWLDLEPVPEMLDVPMVNSSFQKYDSKGGIDRSRIESWKQRLSSGEVGTIQWLTRKAMVAGKYKNQAAGFWFGYALWQVLTLPISFLKAARANRDRVGSLPRYLWRRLKPVLGL